MSYAGPTSKTTSQATTRGASTRATPPRKRQAGPAQPDDFRNVTDWQALALFGAGLTLGIAIGAGAALLSAPQTGGEARAMLQAKARRIGRSTTRRSRDAWQDVRDEVNDIVASLHRRKSRRDAGRARARAMELELEAEAAE